NWSHYILNAFDCPYSNGFTEGIDNTIKVIKRVAYGYRNFDNFCRRILTTVNTKLEPISLHESAPVLCFGLPLYPNI
ncbi:MAG: transposase, partial [Christensenellaceae bacterium]